MTATIRKVLLYLGVLLLTFLAGCLVQFSLRRADVCNTNAPANWKRISIGRMSFYVPPNMEPTGKVGVHQTLTSTNGDSLYLYYAYGSEIHTEVNEIPRQSRQVTISGKPAFVRQWTPPDGPWGAYYQPGMQLVITDVGDGNKFELYADVTNFGAIQQVIDTVEIH